MSLYPKQSMQMLVDLINQANPSLPVPLTTTNALYGTPTAVTPTGGNIQNTSIKVTAQAGTKYVGNTTLLYRRLDFGILFRNLPIVIYKYSPNAGSPFKISDLLPSINAKYGLTLTTADIVDANLPVGNNNAVPAIGLVAGTRNSAATVAAATGSPGFIGSFTLYWVQAPQDIASMISVTSLENARVFPGGRNVVDNGVYVPDLDFYSIDWTNALNQAGVASSQSLAQVLVFLTSYGLGTQTGTGATVHNSLLASINAAITTQYNLTNPASTPYSLYGIKFTNVTLPSAALPEADSKYFNRALYLDLPAGASWGAGRIIMHYNV
jgi:hypothetical protein